LGEDCVLIQFASALTSSGGHTNVALSLLVAGIMAGALYGLIGLALTLMFRSSGVLSFAHAGFSLMAAYIYSGFACPVHGAGASQTQCGGRPVMSPIAALIVIVACTTIAGLIVERLVMRPLTNSSAATKVVATTGVLALIAGLMLQFYGAQPRFTPLKQQVVPQGGFHLGGVIISWQQATLFVISIALVIVIAFTLRRSWFGLGVRAAGQRPDIAQLMGVNPVATERFNWAIGGAISGLAGVLLAPIQIVSVGTFGFLTVKSVGAMVIGGLVSLPATFAGGILIGIVEYLLPHFWKVPGAAEAAVAGVLVGALVLYRRRLINLTTYNTVRARRGGAGPVGSVVARWVSGVADSGRRVPKVVWVVPVAALLLLPLHNGYYSAVGVNGIYYGLLALSVVALTGFTGHISFMQAGFVGLGAFTLSAGIGHHWNILTAAIVAIAVCAVMGVVAGFLALRYRGVEFFILTLAFSAVASEYVMHMKTFGKYTVLNSTKVFGVSMLKSQNLYKVSVVGALICVVLVANLRRSGWGRSVATMRELEDRIAHFGVSPLRSSVILFAVSGGVAGLAGCILALSLTSLDTSLFTPLLSVTIVLVAVVGGVRSLWGPFAAALLFGPGQEVIRRALTDNTANAYPQITSAILALLVVVFAPTGLAGLGDWAKTAVASQDRRLPRVFRGAMLPEPEPDEPVPHRIERMNGGGERLRRPSRIQQLRDRADHLGVGGRPLWVKEVDAELPRAGPAPARRRTARRGASSAEDNDGEKGQDTVVSESADVSGAKQ
jgi:sulfate-transporting ATPase